MKIIFKTKKMLFILATFILLIFSITVKADTYNFEGNISASKTVSELDSNDVAHVRIDLPAAEYKPVYDVVFVIDATNPTLMAGLADSLKSIFIEEIKKDDKITINVGAVIYGTYVTKSGDTYTQSDTTSVQLKELNTLSEAEIQQYLDDLSTAAYTRAYNMQMAKLNGLLIGTNLQSGIIEGRKMLDAGSAVAENKLMVMLTDGGSYMYTKDNETNTNAYVQGRTFDGSNNIVNHGTLKYNDGYDLQGGANYDVNNMTYGKYLSEPNPFEAFYNQEGAGIKSDTNSLSISDYYAALTAASASDYTAQDKVISSSDLPNRTLYPYTGLEKGMYYAAKELKEMSNAGYRIATIGFPYYSQYSSHYRPSQEFMKWTEDSLGGNYIPLASESDVAGVAKAAESIKNEIVYLFNSGTVTEQIGKDFSLVSVDTIDVKVNEVSQARTVDPSNSNKVSFGELDANTGKYPYVATYNPATKQIKWEINVPIQSTNPLSLHFDIKLTKSKIAGKHEGHTGDTTINYVDTYDNSGAESLKGPNVPYVVKYNAKIYFLDEKNQKVEIKNDLNLVADSAKYDFTKNVNLKKEIVYDGKTYVFSKYASGSPKLSGTTPTNDFTIELLYKEKVTEIPNPPKGGSETLMFVMVALIGTGVLGAGYYINKRRV